MRVFVSLTVLVSLSLAHEAESVAQVESAAPRVLNVTELQLPAEGEISVASLRESDRMVARVLRLAPGAVIREHHHPYFEEAFIVYSGAATMLLNDREYVVRSGDVVYIPAGTTISGGNEGVEEAVLVVVWANLGERGPLFVSGRPDLTDSAAVR